ncbi:hypothetical protein FB45DRAFT_274252 [Roridomyces roridus]|uniref:Uncharacterized protein n=1 Tax=Roridomyces roridus TaxID=1738132 RepID=A0AAD7B7T7_9AGAR|nr:hypothetical protein FB45DRAFT_274252 [Roridomyces roridus]
MSHRVVEDGHESYLQFQQTSDENTVSLDSLLRDFFALARTQELPPTGRKPILKDISWDSLSALQYSESLIEFLEELLECVPATETDDYVPNDDVSATAHALTLCPDHLLDDLGGTDHRAAMSTLGLVPPTQDAPPGDDATAPTLLTPRADNLEDAYESLSHVATDNNVGYDDAQENPDIPNHSKRSNKQPTPRMSASFVDGPQLARSRSSSVWVTYGHTYSAATIGSS